MSEPCGASRDWVAFSGQPDPGGALQPHCCSFCGRLRLLRWQRRDRCWLLIPLASPAGWGKGMHGALGQLRWGEHGVTPTHILLSLRQLWSWGRRAPAACLPWDAVMSPGDPRHKPQAQEEADGSGEGAAQPPDPREALRGGAAPILLLPSPTFLSPAVPGGKDCLCFSC